MLEQFLNNMAMGIQIALEPGALFWTGLGVAWGILAGALPGISSSVAISILLPFTFYMQKEYALMMLVGTLFGAGYGGAIPAILIRTPGIPSAVLTVVEGHPMHLRGESGKALGIALITGTIGQVISILALIALVIPLSQAAIKFLFPEIFALAVWGLTAAASLTGKNIAKGLAAAAFGVALSTIGPDPISSKLRFTFGSREFFDGIGLVPVLVGMLAISEVLRASRQVVPWTAVTERFSTTLPSWSDLKGVMKATMIATFIGFIIGIMPGAGGGPAAFISYAEAKRWSKHPEKFGKGSEEGLAAVETANNAVIPGDLVPTLGLGIPGSTATAIFMAAMVMQGILPGPRLVQTEPRLVYSLFAGMMTATTFMLILGILTIGPSVYITTISRPAVMVVTMVLVTVGIYSLNLNIFDVFIAWIFGILGYFMYRYGYSPPAAVLGLVLGGIIERSFRRGMVMSRGSLLAFISRPATAAILLLALATLLYPIVMGLLARRRQPLEGEAVLAGEPSQSDRLGEGGDKT